MGFHAHENLACGIANTLAAIEAGAVQVDASTRRMGAGAGNTPTEALAAVLEKLGIATGIDVAAIADAAEEVVAPLMGRECVLDRMALTMGYAGVYSSFLEHARRAADAYASQAPRYSECAAKEDWSVARRISSARSPTSYGSGRAELPASTTPV